MIYWKLFWDVHALLGEKSFASFIAHWGVLGDFVPNWANLEFYFIFLFILFMTKLHIV